MQPEGKNGIPRIKLLKDAHDAKNKCTDDKGRPNN